MTAFILSREMDLPIAIACQSRMVGLGWNAKIMIDPKQWETLPANVVHSNYGNAERRMTGNNCAMAILDGLIANTADDELIMRMDCDVWLSDEASEWFQSKDNGRAMKIDHHKVQVWGGCWSARRNQIIQARIAAELLHKCRCAESYLNLMALHNSGGLKTRNEIVAQWQIGRDRGLAATLPIAKNNNRVAEGLALFDTANH
jgi:hypothetical protein